MGLYERLLQERVEEERRQGGPFAQEAKLGLEGLGSAVGQCF